MDSVLDDVRKLVAAQSGLPIERIQPSSRLFHDLGIDGDDAEELLVAFGERFSLPIKDFPFSEYFGSEVGAGWRHLFMAVLGIGKVRMKPLTVQQLADWAEHRSDRGIYDAQT
jgi:acyl carrier protein